MNYYLITPAKKKLSTHNYKGDGFVEIRGENLVGKTHIRDPQTNRCVTRPWIHSHNMGGPIFQDR